MTDAKPKAGEVTYAASGVDINRQDEALRRIKSHVKATKTPGVLSDLGLFGGLFAAKFEEARPILVSSMDGVGTKMKVARLADKWDTVGQDLVNHCINDILVQGARPLFFLDYIASSNLDPEIVATVVGGCATACRATGCALLGGETAEMPGIYAAGEFDLVGTIIGVVDRPAIIDGSTIAPGDAVIGLGSTGLHTNGFSLARRVFEGWDLAGDVPLLGRPLGDALLEPHRSYLSCVDKMRGAGVTVKSLAHITGGGLLDNPPRVLPEGVAMRIRVGTWAMPPLFQLIQQTGNIALSEMAHVFNLGLGMLAVVPAEESPAALAAATSAGVPAWTVGEIIPSTDRPHVELQ